MRIFFLVLAITGCKARDSGRLASSPNTPAYHELEAGKFEIMKINGVLDLETNALDKSLVFRPDRGSASKPRIRAGELCENENLPLARSTFDGAWARYQEFVVLKDKDKNKLKTPLLRQFNIILYLKEIPKVDELQDFDDYVCRATADTDSFTDKLKELQKNPASLNKTCGTTPSRSFVSYKLRIRDQPHMSRALLALASIGFFDQRPVSRAFGQGGLLGFGIPDRTRKGDIIESPFSIKGYMDQGQQPSATKQQLEADPYDPTRGPSSYSKPADVINRMKLPQQEFGALVGLATNRTGLSEDRIFGPLRLGINTFATAKELLEESVTKNKIYPIIIGDPVQSKNFSWVNYKPEKLEASPNQPFIECVEILEEQPQPFKSPDYAP